MKIKRIIGYILIATFWIGMIYFYATQVPGWAILVILGGLAVFCGFAALLVWLFTPDKEEPVEMQRDIPERKAQYDFGDDRCSRIMPYGKRCERKASTRAGLCNSCDDARFGY